MTKDILFLSVAAVLFAAPIAPQLLADQVSVSVKNIHNNMQATPSADETLCCRIGKHESYIKKKLVTANDKGDTPIIQNIINALILEVADKYNISPDPELASIWKEEVAFVASQFKEPIDYQKLSPKENKIIAAKYQQFEIVILTGKVRAFIIQDIAAHDPNFALYYTSNIDQVEADPALLSQYQEISTQIASEGGAQAYEDEKINEWWIKFIANEGVSFGNDKCKDIFDKIRKNGPRKP